MTQKATEIETAVNNIGQDIFESTKEVEYFNITLHTDGFVQGVSFCGIELWCSEDDGRLYLNGGDKRESLEDHLRRRLREELTKLAMIKI